MGLLKNIGLGLLYITCTVVAFTVATYPVILVLAALKYLLGA